MFEEELLTMANRVVNQCLGIKPGENVLIEAVDLDDYTIPELLVSECVKTGANPILVATPRDCTKMKLTGWNPENIRNVPAHVLRMFENVDVRISVYDVYSPSWRHLIPDKNLAAFNQFHQTLSNIIMERKIRNLNISIPTESSVRERGLHFHDIFTDFLEEANIDYQRMALLGNKLKMIMQSSNEICVETGNASLTFKSKGRSYMIEDGVIDDNDLNQGVHYAEIPAGEVFTAPVEDSANGEVVFPDIPDYGEIKLSFKNGKVIGVKGEEREKFLKRLKESTGQKDIIGEFAIGLNPGSKQDSEKALGSIHIAIGKNNHLGGKNESSLHWYMIIPKPTVKVDGEILIENGAIVDEVKL